MHAGGNGIHAVQPATRKCHGMPVPDERRGQRSEVDGCSLVA
jgi:hypothetical protein